MTAAPSGIRLASAIASAAGFAILSRFGRGIPASIQRSISWNSSSIRMSDETFFSTLPCAYTKPTSRPPAIPKSASPASPGPFTAQPITATSNACG